MLCALIAVILRHMSRFCIKLSYTTSNISGSELVAVRAVALVLHFVLAVLIVDPRLFRVPRPLRCLLLSRSLSATISFTVILIGLNYLTYSTSMVLFLLYPVFTAVGAFLFLKERLSWVDVLAFLFSLCGVAFFTFPQLLGDPSLPSSQTTQHNTPFGILLALLGSLCIGVTFIITRKIGQRMHYLTIPGYYYLLAALLLCPWAVGVGACEGFKTEWSAGLLALVVGSASLEFLG